MFPIGGAGFCHGRGGIYDVASGNLLPVAEATEAGAAT